VRSERTRSRRGSLPNRSAFTRLRSSHGTRQLSASAGSLACHRARLVWAAWLLIAGLLLFSGSLYLLALIGERWLGALTPIGGVAFVAAWLVLAWVAVTR
jgi:uncharacterized membrane protein YgdD (TMEM256/DUF423 family)